MPHAHVPTWLKSQMYAYLRGPTIPEDIEIMMRSQKQNPDGVPPECHSFRYYLERSCAGESLGLTYLFKRTSPVLMVAQIDTGSICEDHNRRMRCVPRKSSGAELFVPDLQRGDFIAAVNGARNDPEAMSVQLRTKTVLFLEIKRLRVPPPPPGAPPGRVRPESVNANNDGSLTRPCRTLSRLFRAPHGPPWLTATQSDTPSTTWCSSACK